MVLQILDIILVILKKVKIYGYNLMMRESDNLIQVIYKYNVLVDSIGEDKVKVLIY